MCIKKSNWGGVSGVSVNGGEVGVLNAPVPEAIEVATGGVRSPKLTIVKCSTQFCVICNRWALRVAGRPTEWLTEAKLEKRLAEMREEYRMYSLVVEG
jgi:hypothetical protein